VVVVTDEVVVVGTADVDVAECAVDVLVVADDSIASRGTVVSGAVDVVGIEVVVDAMVVVEAEVVTGAVVTGTVVVVVVGDVVVVVDVVVVDVVVVVGVMGWEEQFAYARTWAFVGLTVVTANIALSLIA